MPKDRGRDDIRNAIAVHAALLMAQDGIEDYRLAKRKAARHLGIPEARNLPTNDEIDAALREYRDIYQGTEQTDRVNALRQKAVHVMRDLAAFAPHLTGGVLSGTAGPYAAIRLQLFVDNAKQVELYLLDRGIAYRASQNRFYAGQEVRLFPVFTFDYEDVEVELTVFDLRDLRSTVRATSDGRNIERQRLAAVEALLEAGDQEPASRIQRAASNAK